MNAEDPADTSHERRRPLPQAASCRRGRADGPRYALAKVVPAVGVLLSFALSLVWPTRSVGQGPDGVLSVRGGFLGGSLLDSPAAGPDGRPSVRWQSPIFARPLEFPVEAVSGITFGDAAAAAPGGDEPRWRIELVGGDTIVGRLERIDDERVVVRAVGADAPPTIAVRRSAVRLIGSQGASGTLLWNGLLDGWTLSAPGDWEKAGQGVANTVPGATMVRPIGAAGRQRVDLSLSWSALPALRITVRPGAPAQDGEGGEGDGVRPMAVPDGTPKPPPAAPYVIEVSDGQILALRDEADGDGRGRAVMRSCGPPADRGLSLTLFIDWVLGRLVVKRGDAEAPSVDVALPPLVTAPAAELLVEVVSGTVSLDELRVTAWRGESITGVEDGPGAVILRDGESLGGVITTSLDDPATLVVKPAGEGAAPRSIRLDAIGEIRLPAAGPAGDDGAAPAGLLRCTDRSGTVLSGRLESIGDGIAWIAHPAIEGSVGMPLGSLVSIDAVVPPSDAPPLPGRAGRLIAEGTSLEGCLVPLEASDMEAAAGEAIGWLPAGGLRASPFATVAGGRAPDATIRYVAPPKQDPLADRLGWIGAHIGMLNDKPAILGVQGDSPFAAESAPMPALLLAVAPRGDGRFVETAGLPIEDVTALVRGRVGTEVHLRLADQRGENPRELRLVRAVPRFISDQQSLEQVLATHRRLLETVDAPPESSPDGFGADLVLVTGESITGRVEEIIDGGVTISRPGVDAVTIPADHVQAVELLPGEGIVISPEKYRSLTTLPRTQRGLPPTHLVRSAKGDYLRGRLVGMDGASLRIVMESDPRGKPVAIPRAEVARVIWLHPESLAEDWRPPVPAAVVGLSLEAVSDRGGRTRIAAVAVEGNVLVGAHPVLGPHNLDLESIDRLLLGDLLEGSPRLRPYGQWTLRPATEPRNQPKRTGSKPP